MVRVGDRVKVTGIMRDDPAPMEIGAEGTVEYVLPGTPGIGPQISVKWDNGRTLFLLGKDPFIVTGHVNEGEKE